MPAIHIRTCDDWIAVYKDGKKVFDNHSCHLPEGLEALDVPFKIEDLDDKMDGYGMLKDGGDPFPEVLNTNE